MLRLTDFRINGTDVADTHLRDGELSISTQTNGRGTVECVLVDRHPVAGFRPDLKQEILIGLDDVDVFAGVLWDQSEDDIGGTPGAGTTMPVVFTDYIALTDKVLYNGLIASGTLKSQLTVVLANLAPHGIVISPLQEDGPTLGAQAFDFLTIRECLDEFSLQSGWVYGANASREIRMTEPGTIPATRADGTPLEFTEALGNYRSLSWNRNLNSKVNDAWGRFGPRGVFVLSETFEGDGATRRWPLNIQLIQVGAGVTPSGTVTVTRTGPTVADEAIDADPGAGTDPWHYDVADIHDNALVHDSSETVLAVGESVTITYNAQGPGLVFTRNDADYNENGPFTARIDLPDITTIGQAQIVVDAELRRRLGTPKRLTLRTDEHGLQPLMTVRFDIPSRDVEGDYLVVAVRMVEVAVQKGGGRYFEYEIECVEGNEFKANWEAFWRPVPTDRTGGSPVYGFCTALATLWSDDMQSAAALSADYSAVSNVTKVAGVGPGGSQAAVGGAGFSYVHRNIATTHRNGCCTWTTTLWGAGTFAATTNPIIFIIEGDFAAAEAFEISINRANLNVSIRNGVSTILATSANNVIPAAGTFFDIRVEWTLSSVATSDAEVRVSIDGVLVLTHGPFYAAVDWNIGAPTEHVGYNKLHWGPLAAGVDLVVKGG